MMLSFLFLVSFLIALLPTGSQGQTPRCMTASGGCSNGRSHENAAREASAKFGHSSWYGGDQQIIYSSSTASDSDILVAISYMCLDNSPPPIINGSTIQDR